MKKLLIPSLAVLAMSVTPAMAQTPVPTPPCATSAEYTTVGIAGKTESFAPEPVPSFPYDIVSEVEPQTYREESVTRFKYRIDVSGSSSKPFATNATVNLTLSWDNDTDFDLFVYDKDNAALAESVSFNPLDGSGESVALQGTAHCTDIRIDVVNYLGLPNSELELKTTLTQLKP